MNPASEPSPMCCRFVQKNPIQLLHGLTGNLFNEALLPPPRYNMAPSQQVLSVRSHGSDREIAMLTWGLIPAWTDDPSLSQHPINARCESADAKSMFREALKHRRCVVPAEGFYEWHRQGKDRQAYFVHRRDGQPMMMAGIWDYWKSADGDKVIESVAILTTAAHEVLQGIHDRMPVLLSPAGIEIWLDPKITSTTSLIPLYHAGIAADYVAEPVSSWVNNVAHDDERCLEPERPKAKTGSLFD
jgi:putative SOS response-associated peptidase YedK